MQDERPKRGFLRLNTLWLWAGGSALLIAALVTVALLWVRSALGLAAALAVYVAGEYLLYRLTLGPMFGILLHSLRALRGEFADLDGARLPFDLDDDQALLLHLGDLVGIIRAAVQDEYEAELLQKQAQYSALQSQINPHFLYNTLETIRGQALIEGSDEIARMTEALSTFFRYSISQKGNFVTLRDELDNIENYFFIQNCRFGDRIGLAVEVEDEAALSLYLPKMTLQPIVENGVTHGLEAKLEPGRIVIRVTLTAARMLIAVHDNGMGMEREALRALNAQLGSGEAAGALRIGRGDRHNGIAVFNVNRRLRLLFGESFGLRFASTAGVGTEVEIAVPRITEENLPRESEAELLEA